MPRTLQRDIFPVPAFRVLLETAMRKTADCSAVFCAPSEIPQAGGGTGQDGGGSSPAEPRLTS